MFHRAILGRYRYLSCKLYSYHVIQHGTQCRHAQCRFSTVPSADSSSTISEEEVSKFSDWADTWWDVNGSFAALHSMNDLRVPLVRDALTTQAANEQQPNKPLQGISLLDVGCGGGILSEPLARLGARVCGVDASKEAIESARWHSSLDPDLRRNITYTCCAVEDMVDSQAENFDGVIASEIVEHVANPTAFIASCCKLVKPGGSVFFTTINRTWAAYALVVVAAERLARVAPVGAHDWQKFISPQQVQQILADNHMITRLCHGMTMNPLNMKWCWIANTSMNYAIHAVKVIPDIQHGG